MIVGEGGIIQTKRDSHNHGPVQYLIDTMIVEAQKLEEALANPHTSSKRGFIGAVTNELATPEKIAMASTTKALERRLERGREKAFNFPSLPKDIKDVIKLFPEELRMTASGGAFLRFEGYIEGSSTEACYLFASDTGIEQLLRCKIWTVDGTFKTAVPPFMQVFIINVVINGKHSFLRNFCLMFFGCF